MGRMKQETDIPPRVRKFVYERDQWGGATCCIYCGTPRNIELAHIVPRSRGGKGIEQNLVCLCSVCHRIADNGYGTEARKIREVMRDHVKRIYPGWDEDGMIVRKDEQWN